MYALMALLSVIVAAAFVHSFVYRRRLRARIRGVPRRRALHPQLGPVPGSHVRGGFLWCTYARRRPPPPMLARRPHRLRGRGRAVRPLAAHPHLPGQAHRRAVGPAPGPLVAVARGPTSWSGAAARRCRSCSARRRPGGGRHPPRARRPRPCRSPAEWTWRPPACASAPRACSSSGSGPFCSPGPTPSSRRRGRPVLRRDRRSAAAAVRSRPVARARLGSWPWHAPASGCWTPPPTPARSEQRRARRGPDPSHLKPDLLVLSTQPEQVPTISYYLPSGAPFRHAVGADPRSARGRLA